jgi:hypothetical protein
MNEDLYEAVTVTAGTRSLLEREIDPCSQYETETGCR